MGVVIWGSNKFFSAKELGVQRALKHPVLQGKTVIGRGVYSIVLSGGISVFKLTIDRMAYALAEHQVQWQSSVMPVILGLHGIVGATDTRVPLFLIEMERLDKLVTGTDVRKRCLSIARQLKKYIKYDDSPAVRLRRASALQQEAEMERGLMLLADFIESRWPAAELDLHSANFMRRPDTGEAVITDPIMDMETRNIVLEHAKRNFPEGTMIV